MKLSNSVFKALDVKTKKIIHLSTVNIGMIMFNSMFMKVYEHVNIALYSYIDVYMCVYTYISISFFNIYIFFTQSRDETLFLVPVRVHILHRSDAALVGVQHLFTRGTEEEMLWRRFPLCSGSDPITGIAIQTH